MPVKNPTSWRPPSGQGYIITEGLLDFQDNSGNLLVTNSLDNIVTTPTYAIGKYATAWTASGV